jgi:hypothetical protein
MVERPDDLRGLQAVVDQLRGVTCWRARHRYGGELVLDLGAQQQYRHPRLAGRDRGTWVLGTRASPWDVAEQEPSTEANGDAGALPEIEGARVSAAEVGFPGLELTLRFDNGAVLRIAPDPDEHEVASWELFTASGMYLQVGPGRRWHYAAADQQVE